MIKRALTHGQLKADGVHLNCTAHVVDSLKSNTSSSTIGVYSSQVRNIKHVFWEVRIGEVNREKTWVCQGIPEL